MTDLQRCTALGCPNYTTYGLCALCRPPEDEATDAEPTDRTLRATPELSISPVPEPSVP